MIGSCTPTHLTQLFSCLNTEWLLCIPRVPTFYSRNSDDSKSIALVTIKHSQANCMSAGGPVYLFIFKTILRLLFVLAMKHTLLHMFLSIWHQICLRETYMILLFRIFVQLSVEKIADKRWSVLRSLIMICLIMIMILSGMKLIVTS